MRALIVGAVAVAILLLLVTASLRVELVGDGRGNEVLAVRMRGGPFAGESGWLIDTAFAGAPVLSLSYLHLLHTDRAFGGLSLGQQHRRLARVAAEPTEAQAHGALDWLLRSGSSRTFTSGCAMRLASVGEVTESFSDMLLCPALRTGVYRSEGDVFVTNALRNSLNVLTSDFLFHRAPVLVRPRQGTLAFRASALQIGAGFSYVPTELVGGAPCVRVRVGGAELRMLVDSGASACAAVNPQVKLEGRPQRQHVTQLGVHGEHVCSAVLLADVELAGTTLRDVPVFQNRAALAHADGYVGLGILRTFDWVVLPDAFGFRNNGLGTQDGYAFSDGEC